ncbi:hypothetical protein Z517_00624 [Fonsecaea pedrosoi CBS 271.37]|uniref:Unplaced genomic scaffold supercont1.1, whole genome shotgun sequence n=1 Tax=Fonsecaea pedrosoi CBS 271.37 TaxID=1442368 RepID=A0A0D2HL58_9EURO|nr:uncharacterized protein Z517_00624 [Fonsecaea pedrosoi CBS 271.37]KIW85234.1 hypothetical protein Z517_00624 [Fonsecaea pedrosoi CBS 271.37]
MAPQPEGSNPSLTAEGWTFLESDNVSEISNSSSLDELFEQNRLHLTVNPLDPFLPTIRPTNDLFYDPIVPAATQSVSPARVDASDDDAAAAETKPDQADLAFQILDTPLHDATFDSEDYFDDILSGSFVAGYVAPAEEQVSSYENAVNANNYDFLDLDLATNDFAPGNSMLQPASQLASLDTFDPDFWASFPTDIDTGSPFLPSVLDNVHYPPAPEEVLLTPRSLSNLADFYGYSDLITDPTSTSAPQHSLADALPTVPDQEPEDPLLEDPGQLGMSQPWQHNLSELGFSQTPIDFMLEDILSQTDDNDDNATLSDSTLGSRSFTESAVSSSSSATRSSSKPSGRYRHSPEWFEAGVRRQRKAASKTPAADYHERLARKREEHRQYREGLREKLLRGRGIRRLHTPPPTSSSPLHLAVPRSTPTQRPSVYRPRHVAPASVLRPAQPPVANPGTRVVWYQKESASTGAVLGYVRHVEEFYPHLPATVGTPLIRVTAPAVTPVSARSSVVSLPVSHRGQAPLPTPAMHGVPAVLGGPKRPIFLD